MLDGREEKGRDSAGKKKKKKGKNYVRADSQYASLAKGHGDDAFIPAC